MDRDPGSDVHERVFHQLLRSSSPVRMHVSVVRGGCALQCPSWSEAVSGLRHWLERPVAALVIDDRTPAVCQLPSGRMDFADPAGTGTPGVSSRGTRSLPGCGTMERVLELNEVV